MKRDMPDCLRTGRDPNKVETKRHPFLGGGEYEKEFSSIPWNISTGRSFSVRRPLLLALEIIMYTKEGYFHADQFSVVEWNCIRHWGTLEFLKAIPVRECSSFARVPEGVTHRMVFSPEAWDLAHTARRQEYGGLTLPSVKYQEDLEIEERDKDRFIRKHPAYGMIKLHRTTGDGQTLYGSDFKHDSSIRLTLCTSKMERDHNRSWFYAQKQKFEIAMSESQWGAFLSSMNQGSGVPCTIRFDERGRIPECPYSPEVLDFKQELDVEVENIVALMDEAMAMGNELGKGKTIKKKEFKDLLAQLWEAQRTLYDRLPFLKQSYEEAMSKTTQAAAREIEAKLQMLIQAVGTEGIQKIKALGGTDRAPSLQIEGAPVDPVEEGEHRPGFRRCSDCGDQHNNLVNPLCSDCQDAFDFRGKGDKE
jgi:hypothetical protein